VGDGGWRIVAVVCASVFLSVLNASIVNVTLPTIGQDLGVEPGRLGWVITIYLLVYGVAIPFYGRLADLYGARRFFVLGQAVFALGSLLCALAPSYPLLLAARVVQAGGGAAVPGLGVALIGRVAPPDRRGTVLGVLSTTVGAASAIGPTLGGFVTDALGWHYVFALGVLAGLLVPASRAILAADEGRGGSRLDVWGGLFLGLGIVGALLAGTEGARAGWGAPIVLWAAAASAAGFVALILRQRGAESPFVPRDLLENRRYLALGALSFCTTTAFVGHLIGLPLLLAGVNGLPPSQVGLVLLPSAALNAVLGVIVGRLVDQAGARVPVRAGLALMLLAVLGLSTSVGAPPWVMAALLGLLGMGVAFANTPLSTAVSLLVRPERLPSAQSINTMLFFLGGSFGTTLVTAVVAARGRAAESLNPLHAGPGVGFSDAFLLLAVPLLIGLALSAAVPGPAVAEQKVGGSGRE
jgi:DHA2 family metal-tetracycline-proton antiporter-like MFS transporter